MPIIHHLYLLNILVVEIPICLFTTTGTAAPSERMRIDKDGNVGIGTIDPQAGLDVIAQKVFI